MATRFDPVRAFYDELDAFPALGSGNVARLMLDTQRMLIYSLGDESSAYPFCHVVVLVYGDEDFATRFYRSHLHAAVSRLHVNDPDDFRDTQKARHFHFGHRERDRTLECVFQRVLEQLRTAHGADLLRAYQLGNICLPEASSSDLLPVLLWKDVLRVIMQRTASLLRAPAPEDLLRLAHRMETRYGYNRAGCCCSRFRRWWWRVRLRARLVHHYPSLPKRSLKLLADDIKYLVRYPYSATAAVTQH